ncbi:uncharacterized protein BP5553_09690 [Venustampulla echinocandica]|uniref:Zn(2)-C6 fungal-type domain-containing protein n=1 Tax=Venustampulla echinocandica TaxID=2656787 RepID=A0A370TBQ0_9HELO|nr:uncharacterized protein BP5553_09690 [Venustampulla echinocandica]RDL31481.1 hypothetical protein BP5553_09690 [Venustampulla echinocandica]
MLFLNWRTKWLGRLSKHRVKPLPQTFPAFCESVGLESWNFWSQTRTRPLLDDVTADELYDEAGAVIIECFHGSHNRPITSILLDIDPYVWPRDPARRAIRSSRISVSAASGRIESTRSQVGMASPTTENELGLAKDPEPVGGDDEDAILTAKRSKKGQGPRKRVSQACDKCRSRKDKCDGKKPACSTCISNARTCSYDTNVKKRGLPEGYVRGLEKLWGVAIQGADDIEETILEALKNGKEVDTSSLKTWNDEANSEKLVNVWRRSHLSRELERLLSGLEPSAESSNKRKRAGSDFQAAQRPDLYRPTELEPVFQPGNEECPYPPYIDTSNEFADSSSLDGAGERGQYATRSASILTPSYGGTAATPISSTGPPDLPSETWHLLDVHFSYTHPWLPIIEKHDILRTSYQYPESQRPPSSSGDQAALWAVIAYAKFQHRAINNIPRAQGSVRDMVWTAERMYSQARSLIPDEEGIWELGHIQALLILTLSNMGIGHLDRAWLLVGQAVRAATQLGIANSNSEDPTPTSSSAKSRAKHVFLGCFVLDTIIAARLGRRPHLRRDDIDEVGPLDEDGLDEWDPWNDCLSVRRESSGNSRVPASILSTFNRLIQLLKVLNDAICVSRNSDALQISSGLLEKLYAWGEGQPSPLYFDSSARSREQISSLLPHQYHLHAAYLTTLATSQLLSHISSPGRVDLEPCIPIPGQLLELLKNHSHKFGLLIVPPTYEYFMKRAHDVLNEVQGNIENTHIMINDWRHGLDIQLDAMEPAWPSFELLKNSVSCPPSSHNHREGGVALDRITGTNQPADTPLSTATPPSATSFERPGSYRPPVLAPQRNMQRPRTMSQPVMAPPPRPLPRSESFGRTSGPGLPELPTIYQDSRALLGPRNADSSRSTVMKSPGDLSKLDYASLDTLPSVDPQLQSSICTGSENDIDPLFNEFAALDAMEWTGNWDQSLLNLGFTDRDNMNQDFYAFCQDPDPFHPNNVFQQLAANSSTEGTNFFGGPGFLGVRVDEEDEGIEAGQILQALRAAEDQQALVR